ncbi:enolase C-terminal domain-like protein [Paludibaculum fermentans]|uniref:enolase C-terminal domain-like protein n=1 Tax=Paludibaculum fermentans TaxID=1473598 RepID=UPI003EBBA9D6
MERRHFLSVLASAPALMAAPAASRISAVEMWRLAGRRMVTPGQDGQYQVQATHVYDALRPKPYKDNPQAQRESAVNAIYLNIKTADGLEGWYGPVDQEAALVIETQIKPFVMGKDALAGEALWDQMWRSNRHARAGLFLMGISAVDNCLWDLRGRYYKTPVYRLLGGPTRADVEVYGSCLGFSVELEPAFRKAQELKAAGYRHQKWFLAYGPGDGDEGLEKNVALVRTLREAVGENVELMFDVYSGWSLDYAIAWAKQVEKYHPRWLEEAFNPDKLESFVALHKATSIPIASGEHFYGRWETKRYLESGAISVVQADPEWCGGLSELVKICGIASLYDAQVLPHGHSIHAALHVIASQSPAVCPRAEYLITKMRSYYWFEKNQMMPVQARIALPDGPGFGIEFDEARVEKKTLFKV